MENDKRVKAKGDNVFGTFSANALAFMSGTQNKPQKQMAGDMRKLVGQVNNLLKKNDKLLAEMKKSGVIS